MAAPLIHLHDLIVDSWRDFAKNWNASLKFSKWYFITTLISFLIILITRQWLGANNQVTLIVYFITNVGLFFVSLWATIRLARWTLLRDRKQNPTSKELHASWRFFWSFFWIGLLAGLAVLGGLAAFVLPGIWLTIHLKFAQYTFLEDNERGVQALAATHHLVKGRWWATFWRVLIPNALFLFIFLAVTSIIGAFVSAIAGLSNAYFLEPATANDVLIESIRQLVSGIGAMIFAPLFTWVDIKLFHNLKQTR